MEQSLKLFEKGSHRFFFHIDNHCLHFSKKEEQENNTNVDLAILYE